MAPEMGYPQQTKIHGMIELMYWELQRAYDVGGPIRMMHGAWFPRRYLQGSS